jgi:hypothetical protein
MVSFDPTAGLTDFDAVAGLRMAWSQMISDLMDAMNFGHFPPPGPPSALDELRAWGGAAADLRFYNPLSMSTPAGSMDANVTWRALPTSYDQTHPNKHERSTFLDNPHFDTRLRKSTRIQDEYNEWILVRDQNNKIVKVVFTSEPALYYEFLADPPDGVDRGACQALLLTLYKSICGDASIQLADLFDGTGAYDAYNKWNAQYAVHMQQENNTLGAEVNIAARSAILRKDTETGTLKTGAAELIACGGYGEHERQSDPSIGAAVNRAVQENRFITLQNPVGLYMTGLDTAGWVTPDGTDPATFWRTVRGQAGANPETARIVRAEFAVPARLGYTVSDIKIGGISINFGADIAAHIGMRLGVTVSPPATGPAPRAIGCLDQLPRALALAPAARHLPVAKVPTRSFR